MGRCVSVRHPGAMAAAACTAAWRLLAGMLGLVCLAVGESGGQPIPTDCSQYSSGSIEFSSMDYTGTIPTELGLCTELTGNFEFGINLLTGTIPSELGMLTNLAGYFDLHTNLLTGTIPSELALLTNLATGLTLSHNSLTGTIPLELALLTNLAGYFSLHTNLLTGTIPSELVLLTNLAGYFNLGSNSLTGTIPSELALLTKLADYFSLHTNSLMGTIPSELALLTNLTTGLTLSHNSLTGTIPSELALLTNLTGYFNLGRNSLTGTIPSELALLTKLADYFSLYTNLLTGTIPSELGMLTGVAALNLQTNQLCGVEPPEVVALGDGVVNIDDNSIGMPCPTSVPTISSAPTLRPTTPAPTLLPTTPLPSPIPWPAPSSPPTVNPTTQPSPVPTSKPWYDTDYINYVYGGAAMFGAIVAGILAWQYQKRVHRRPPLLRILSCASSSASAVTDGLYCYLTSTTGAQFCEKCPNDIASLVVFLNMTICGVLLGVVLNEIQLALDGEATFKRVALYAPVLLLAAHDGNMVVWLPWTDSEPTRKLDGFPDATSMEYTSWCIVLRKIPMFILQTRDLLDEPETTSFKWLCCVMSGANLIHSLALKGLQSLAVRRMDIDVAIVPRSQVRRADSLRSGGTVVTGSGAGYSLVATAGVDDGHLNSPLLESDLSGVLAGPETAESGAVEFPPLLLTPPRSQTFIGSVGGRTSKRLKGVLLVCLGVGIPSAISFDVVPSDEMVSKIILLVIMGFVGLVVLVAILFCVIRGGAHIGKRKIVRQSFLEEREAEIERQQQENEQQRQKVERQQQEAERQREEVQRRDERIEYVDHQLEARGISIEEYYRLSEAKTGYEEAFQRYNNGDTSAEADVTKWSNVLSAHPERLKEVERENLEWAAREMPRCNKALQVTRTFVPNDVSRRTLDDLMESGLARPLASRILQKKQLWLAVMHRDDIARLHHVELQNKFTVTGCDIVELRAIFAVLPSSFSNDPGGEKETWRKAVRDKLKTMTLKEEKNQLMPNEKRHSAYRSVDDGVGPFDPHAPLIRNAAIKSSAFDPTPRPISEEPTSTRIQNLQAMLSASQAAQAEEPPRPTRSPGVVDPSLQSRTEDLARLMAERAEKRD